MAARSNSQATHPQVCNITLPATLDEPAELGHLVIAGLVCRLICVDGVLPRHQHTRGSQRPRLTYADGEIVHFDLAGHRYALVADPVAGPEALAADAAARDLRTLLTHRELQIVQLISMGCLTKQVADRLRLSEFTVRSYLKTVYCKLGVRSRGAMVYRYAQAFNTALTPEREPPVV